MSEVSLHTLLHPPNSLSSIDHRRWIAEAHKRMSTPIAALSYALIALLSVLTGAFRRHASFLRPVMAVGGVVILVAFNLASQNLAARQSALLALLWAETIVPPVLFGAMLFGPLVVAFWQRTFARTA
jgi:lipopolysaccharide export system permease protein